MRSTTSDGARSGGIFSPFHAGALAGVTGNRIGQWARYGLIKPSYYSGRPTNLYEFRDVAEAIIVHWLLDRGFRYEEVHTAIARVRLVYGDWPLSEAPLGVAQHAVKGDPRGTVVLHLRKGVYVDVIRQGDQLTLPPQMLDLAHDVLRRGGWIAEEMGLSHIEVDPAKLAGRPVVIGRRWPVDRVAQLAGEAQGRATLVEDYGLSEEEIGDSVRWMDEALAL
jgi:uncharacterized protein (DUF433 family)